MAIYSHSRLSTFENCPLQYKFNYIDRIKRAGKGIEAFMGSCFHDVMEKLYKDLKDSGVKLVNTFAELAAQKKKQKEEISKIDEEMDKLKEAVIKYAEKEDIDVIKGSDHKLKISERQKASSPPKDSPERRELEDILREVNKWNEVSALDTNAIGKIIIAEQWDKETTDNIRKFLTIEVKKQVSLSKLQ